MNYIICLVGPSGSGKTTIIEQALSVRPQTLVELKSTTTRPKRSDSEARNYNFVSREQMNQLIKSNAMANVVEYAGNTYGYQKTDIQQGLQDSHLICAIVEPSVLDLQTLGYPLRVVKIIPEGQTVDRGPERKLQDQERAKIQIPVDLEIKNRFAPKGLQAATQELIEFIDSL